MNTSNMDKPSETDWKRVEEMTDGEIDTSDSPPIDDDFFEKARLRVPKKQYRHNQSCEVVDPFLDPKR